MYPRIAHFKSAALDEALSEKVLIKGIARIKGLGVFEDYTKPNGTKEFGVKNIVYGWNYSGKTTLSRLFALLEHKTQNPDLAGSHFTFETDQHPITESNYGQSSLTVRVFNSDFVRDNLHFGGESFKPILLLGKESEEAQNKIDSLNQRLKRSDARLRIINARIADAERALGQAKTDTAKRIRQTLKIDPYNATHLSNDIQVVSCLDSQLLPQNVFNETLELALTPDNKKPSESPRVS